MMRKKGFMLIVSVLLTLVLAMIISIALYRSSLELKDSEVRREALYALLAAETGVERALFELRRDIDWDAGFGSAASPAALQWQDGTTVGLYWMVGPTQDIAVGDPLGVWETRWLRSWGRDPGQGVTRVIRAHVAVGSPAAFFSSTLGDIKVGSGADITGTLLARDMYFDVNMSLPPGDRRIDVDGDVLYMRNVYGLNNPPASSFINITGSVTQIPPIAFVGVDLDRYRNLAQGGGRYETGDFTYSGDISNSDLSAANGLLFAEGDVHITGDVKDSFLIVAGGDIYLDGDITCQPDKQIGLFAADDVFISDTAPSNIDVEALVIADGGIFKAQGDKGTKGDLDFNGAISVRGKTGVPTVIDLNVYVNRNYSYNTTLLTDNSIPFMTFMATTVRWEEINGTETFPPP